MQLLVRNANKMANDENVNWNCQRHYKHLQMNVGKVVGFYLVALRVMSKNILDCTVHVEMSMQPKPVTAKASRF